jgi:hypothetical protein
VARDGNHRLRLYLVVGAFLTVSRRVPTSRRVCAKEPAPSQAEGELQAESHSPTVTSNLALNLKLIHHCPSKGNTASRKARDEKRPVTPLSERF